MRFILFIYFILSKNDSKMIRFNVWNQIFLFFFSLHVRGLCGQDDLPPTFSTSTRNPQQNLSYFVQSKDVWNQPQKRRAEPHVTSLSFLILGRPTESQWVSLDIHWCGFNFFKNARISQARFHLIAQ